ncbi:hypothetical protein MRB53_024326 [Persea americana]|uniref:Uncharacterized protein n=1 Tax=Persea americana TaxID=3435 RepID=A0ACC2LD55_PERAE|nr:hypothetical protein MRB53_024326 [Persea americana]
MLFHGGVPKRYWVEAFSTAVWLINRLPARVLDMKSPYEKLFGRIPDYGSLRIFGSHCFPYLRDYARTKFDPRSLPCVFLGYSDQYKGYRYLYPPTGRVYTSRHVVFDETNFPFQEPGRLFMIANSTVDLTTFLKWFPGSDVDIMTTSQNASPPFIGPSYTSNIILGDNDNTRTHDSCDRVYSPDDLSPSGHDGPSTTDTAIDDSLEPQCECTITSHQPESTHAQNHSSSDQSEQVAIGAPIVQSSEIQPIIQPPTSSATSSSTSAHPMVTWL